jgi:hypothetical protein
VIVDISFIGTRGLLHVKYSRDFAFYIFFTGALYSLAVLDTVMIFYESANLIYATYMKMNKSDEEEKNDPKIEKPSIEAT